MGNVERTNANDATAEPGETPSQGREDTLAELTRCLSDACTARVRMRLERGEFELALADWVEAIRQAPDRREAHRLRNLVRERQDHDQQIEVAADQTEPFDQAQTVARRVQTRFLSGYIVVARYPGQAPDCPDEPLGSPFPLTPEGRLAAIESARRICRDESRRQRQDLYDAYWTGGEEFDTVVWEFRSLAREVHVEKALDEDGQPIIE